MMHLAKLLIGFLEWVIQQRNKNSLNNCRNSRTCGEVDIGFINDWVGHVRRLQEVQYATHVPRGEVHQGMLAALRRMDSTNIEIAKTQKSIHGVNIKKKKK